MAKIEKNDIKNKIAQRQRLIQVATGKIPASLVFKNATYVNVFTNELLTGDIAVVDGFIAGIGSYSGVEEIDCTNKILLPGFMDAHIHLESSLVNPAEFTKAVLPHGTTSVFTDPHEIANVMGTDGIEFMLQATEGLPIDVNFMLPSCVPATLHDESGANLDYKSIESFYKNPRVRGLAEMMNFVGVVNHDFDVVAKIVSAQSYGKIVDGHAPNLNLSNINAYIGSGIYSDHECSDLEDALSKIKLGLHVMIREGTAAHNLETLIPLLTEKYYSRCMFCTDDKHPSSLLETGHIDYIVKKAISLGVNPIIAVKAASYNVARYFSMNEQGAIAPGFICDLLVIDNFENFNIERVYKNGILVAENGISKEFSIPQIDKKLEKKAHNTFNISPLSLSDFEDSSLKSIIGIVNGEIITTDEGTASCINLNEDILKIAVVERHKNTKHIGIGNIKGYGLKEGAVATSISHDSHNIIVVGTNESDMVAAVNRIIGLNGGIVVMNKGQVVAELPLAIAGIMSDDTMICVNEKLECAKEKAYNLGVGRGIDPFMTLSFMALPVIPVLRITTKGVFDVVAQKFC